MRARPVKMRRVVDGFVALTFVCVFSMVMLPAMPAVCASPGTDSRDLNGFTAASTGLPTNGEYVSVAVGDFNRDGFLDIGSGILSWSAPKPGLDAWVNNNGAQSWTKQSTGLPDIGSPGLVVAADIDKDGDDDLVVPYETTWSGQPAMGIRIYKSDGTANVNWTEGTGPTTTGGFVCVAVADLNKDGNLDIVGTHHSGVRAWFGNGGTSWTEKSTGLPTTRSYYGVDADDMNKDGNMDIVVGGWDEAPNAGAGLRVFTGDGTGTWTYAESGLPTNNGYVGVNVSDLDNDGNPDIVAAMPASGIVAYTGNGGANGSLQFTKESSGLTTTGGYEQMAVGDIDLDGDMDIFGGEGYGGGVKLYLGNGGDGGSLSWTQYTKNLPSSGAYAGAMMADLDNDGDLDLIASDAGQQPGGSVGIDAWLADAAIPIPRPVARVGPDQTVFIGDKVMLNGTNSTALNGKTITTYLWNITEQPTGSAITLDATTPAKPTFTPHIVGDYKFTLAVKDSESMWSNKEAKVNITAVPRPNVVPVANAGPDQTTRILTLVQLDGSGSTDDAPIAVFKWNTTKRPDGSEAALNATGIVNPSFTPDLIGIYKFTLTVKDTNGTWAKDDEVVITVNPAGTGPPTADAGADQTLELGDTVELNGSASKDDQQITTFKWSVVSQPSGSSIVLADVQVQAIEPLIVGAYDFGLMVRDNDNLWSESDTVTVTVLPKDLDPEPVIERPKDGASFLDSQVISFSAEGSEDPEEGPLDYEWTSSIDGKLSTDEEFDTNLTAGVHTITLKVTDDHGHSVSASIDITVLQDKAPTVELSADKELVLKGDTVKFDASDSKDPEGLALLFMFDYGDGTQTSYQDKAKMNHKYTTVGTYEASVSVKDAAEHATVSETLTITVGAAPTAKLVMTSVKCVVGEPCGFDASNSTDEDGSVVSYQFDYGDSQKSDWVSTATITHAFAAAGSYTVKVRVKDDHGFESTNNALVTVNVEEKASGGGAGTSSMMGSSLVPILLVVIIVVVLLAVMLMRRKKAVAAPPPAVVPPSQALDPSLGYPGYYPQQQPMPPPPPPPPQPMPIQPQPQQPQQYGAYDQTYYQQQPPQQQQDWGGTQPPQ